MLLPIQKTQMPSRLYVFALAVVTATALIHGCALVPAPTMPASDVAIMETVVPDRQAILTAAVNNNSAAKATIRPVVTGKASWYGPGFRGKKTASGEIYDDSKLTAAHKSLPLGSKAKVTNLSNGKTVDVEINDRGPFVEDRIIDLSQAAARALGMIHRGIAKVRVDLIGGQSGIKLGRVE